MAIAAVYEKGTGRLIETNVKQIKENNTVGAITIMTALNEDVYSRAFLWEENMMPIAFAEWKYT